MAVKTRVDHDAKRRAVARATWSVIRRKGLDRTGIRDIADELGSTVSVVTHYFRTRDELIRFACDEVFAAYRDRFHAAGGRAESLGWLEQILLDGLPVEPNRELGWEVWIAFLGHAIGRPDHLLEEARRQATGHELLIAELERMRAAGTIPAATDVVLEADLLGALIDGLGIARVSQPARYDGPRIKQLLRSHLESRFGYRPSHAT